MNELMCVVCNRAPAIEFFDGTACCGGAECEQKLKDEFMLMLGKLPKEGAATSRNTAVEAKAGAGTSTEEGE